MTRTRRTNLDHLNIRTLPLLKATANKPSRGNLPSVCAKQHITNISYNMKSSTGGLCSQSREANWTTANILEMQGKGLVRETWQDRSNQNIRKKKGERER